MVEAGRVERMQHGRRGRGAVAVQQHRHAAHARGHERAEHGGGLEAAEAAQHLQRRPAAMPCRAEPHGFDLRFEPRAGNARAGPGPVFRPAPVQRKRDGGGRGGVAMPISPIASASMPGSTAIMP